MKGSLFAAIAAALAFAATATASPSGDMAAAMKALHYPKAGALKLGCRRAGAGFNCKSTYRQHRVRRFYAAWVADGGFVCAGSKPSTCKTLRHGFMTTGTVALLGGPQSAADVASKGYMKLKYGQGITYPATPCTQPTTTNSWSFCYKLDTGSVNVTVHLAKTKGGYVTSTSAVLY